MAMCKSISMISAIDPEKRAPYRAFICTTRVFSSDEIYRVFLAFANDFDDLGGASSVTSHESSEKKLQ